MFRSNLTRTLGMLAAGVACFVVTGPSAFAGLFGRHSSCCYWYSNVVASDGDRGDGIPPDGNGVLDPVVVRQVRVIYFSTEFNAWFEVDGVVPPAGAAIGLSAIVTVPKVGAVRGWVVSVYRQPRMTSPYKMETNDAAKQNEATDATGAATGTTLLTPKQNAKNNIGETHNGSSDRNSLIGATRLWTNKEGTRQAIAELLEIRRDTIVLRNLAGAVFEQPLVTLSDADVAFLRTSSMLAAAN